MKITGASAFVIGFAGRNRKTSRHRRSKLDRKPSTTANGKKKREREKVNSSRLLDRVFSWLLKASVGCRKLDAGLEQSETSHTASFFKSTASDQEPSWAVGEESEVSSQRHSEENLLRRFRKSLDLDAKQSKEGGGDSNPRGKETQFSHNWNDISSGSFCMGKNSVSETTTRLKNMKIRNSKPFGQRVYLRKVKTESSRGVNNVSVVSKSNFKNTGRERGKRGGIGKRKSTYT